MCRNVFWLSLFAIHETTDVTKLRPTCQLPNVSRQLQTSWHEAMGTGAAVLVMILRTWNALTEMISGRPGFTHAESRMFRWKKMFVFGSNHCAPMPNEDWAGIGVDHLYPACCRFGLVAN
jgi:hypothetical protein